MKNINGFYNFSQFPVLLPSSGEKPETGSELGHFPVPEKTGQALDSMHQATFVTGISTIDLLRLYRNEHTNITFQRR